MNVRTARRAVGFTLRVASTRQVNLTLQTLRRLGAMLGVDPAAPIAEAGCRAIRAAL